MPPFPHTPSARQADQPPARHASDTSHWPCDDIIVLKEKVAALEAWRKSTEMDLKEIHDVISQVKLLMSLSIGGGGLSVLTLIITIVLLVTGNK